MDYLNPDAIALFIEKTHEAYRENLGEELLPGVMGFFMDETRFYYCYPWTERFAEEFRKRKGYDLLPHLHELFGEGTRTQAEMDYLDTAAELYKEATFWQVYRWCEKYGLLSTAHLLGEETLAAHARFEIDLMRQYEAMHIPGIDHLGCGIGSLDARFAVSAARNYGKDRVSCEAFGAAGWETGMEEVIRASNWLIQQGINLLTVHGYYYSTRDGRQNDFPPSYFFQWKDWEKAGDYNRMAARMMELASGGRPFEDILVYYPVETFWKHYRPDPLEGTGFGENSRRLESPRAAQIDREYQIFLNGLSDRNIPFRIFNSDSAKNFEIREGKWVNRLNGDTFSTFVMVNVEILPENVQKLLKTFQESGGRILSWNSGELEKLFPDGTEENAPTAFERDSSCRSLEELLERCQEVSDIGIDVLEGTSSCRHNQPSYSDHLIDPYIHSGEDLYGMGISRYDRDGYRIYNFTNYNLREEVLRVRIRGAAEAQIWNPENGEIREAQIRNPENGEIREAQIWNPENGKEWETAGNSCCVIFSVPKNRTRYLVCRA
ncbi:MAG: glycosyl hydrolase [Candidatus Limivivens sp.]|nr:glycosyl hydrolase [Candidatus Limivivens sp.]